MAKAIVSSRKNAVPSKEQLQIAAAAYESAYRQVADGMQKLHAAVEDKTAAALRKQGIHATPEQIEAYREAQRKSAPLSQEDQAARAKRSREYAERLLCDVGVRIGDVGVMAESLKNGELDELGSEATGRLIFLACVRAACELQHAGKLLGLKDVADSAAIGVMTDANNL